MMHHKLSPYKGIDLSKVIKASDSKLSLGEMLEIKRRRDSQSPLN